MYIYMYIYIYINLWTAVVSLVESSSAQLRSNECMFIYVCIYMGCKNCQILIFVVHYIFIFNIKFINSKESVVE